MSPPRPGPPQPCSPRCAERRAPSARATAVWCRCWSQSASLLLESVEVFGQIDQVIIAAGHGLEEQAADFGRVASGSPRHRLAQGGAVLRVAEGPAEPGDGAGPQRLDRSVPRTQPGVEPAVAFDGLRRPY